MAIVITQYDDGGIVVTRNSVPGDDVIRETEANCEEDWASDRMANIKTVDGGYAVTIDEEILEYKWGVYSTLQEAEEGAVHWVGLWPGGWCDAHFAKGEAAA